MPTSQGFVFRLTSLGLLGVIFSGFLKQMPDYLQPFLRAFEVLELVDGGQGGSGSQGGNAREKDFC